MIESRLLCPVLPSAKDGEHECECVIAVSSLKYSASSGTPWEVATPPPDRKGKLESFFPLLTNIFHHNNFSDRHRDHIKPSRRPYTSLVSKMSTSESPSVPTPPSPSVQTPFSASVSAANGTVPSPQSAANGRPNLLAARTPKLQSCQPCRISKLRCSHEQPCARCARLGRADQCGLPDPASAAAQILHRSHFELLQRQMDSPLSRTVAL